MNTTRLARRIGLDRNPLRRRTDKVAAGLTALLLAVFLIGAPLLSVAAAGWAARAAAADRQAERSWRQVSAVLLSSASLSASGDGLAPYSWDSARWTAPDGRTRTGDIPVSLALAAGQVVPLWVDQAGSPTGPPVSHRAVVAREVGAAAFAALTLGILLLCLAGAARWILERRRLADWETAWTTIGPQWTRRFRSRDNP
jgi:hypothetical protein